MTNKIITLAEPLPKITENQAKTNLLDRTIITKCMCDRIQNYNTLAEQKIGKNRNTIQKHFKSW